MEGGPPPPRRLPCEVWLSIYVSRFRSETGTADRCTSSSGAGRDQADHDRAVERGRQGDRKYPAGRDRMSKAHAGRPQRAVVMFALALRMEIGSAPQLVHFSRTTVGSVTRASR